MRSVSKSRLRTPGIRTLVASDRRCAFRRASFRAVITPKPTNYSDFKEDHKRQLADVALRTHQFAGRKPSV
jgi:hypothetical protein